MRIPLKTKLAIIAAMALGLAACTALSRVPGPYDEVTPDNPIPVRVQLW
jgi:hypothetical protein